MISSSEQTSGKFSLMAILCCIVILFLFGKTNISYPITTSIRHVMFPLLEGSRNTQAIIQNEWATFTQLRAQRSQIEQLQEENTKLSSENAFLKILREEQKSWYAQHKIKPIEGFIPVPAVIVFQQDRLVLTAKSETTVAQNSIVIANDHLIGLVTDVHDRTVTAIPLTHLNKELGVVIVGKEGVKGRGVLSQSYGTISEVKRVLQNIPVAVGDDIMLLPSDSWPDNIRIGKVKKIIKQESDVFQTLTITQEIDLSHIVNVVILTKI